MGPKNKSDSKKSDSKKSDSRKSRSKRSAGAQAPKPEPTLAQMLRLSSGPVDLDAIVCRATPGFPGAGTDDTVRRVLVILQGMDTSGKGGVIRKAIGLVDPQGVKITSFRAPTAEERKRPFLWRITNALPGPGMIGLFDRSQYEDVLVARVNELVTRRVWSRRYSQINAWEKKLAEAGTIVIKCYLHITLDDQKERLQARLDDPTKHWKYNPGDLDVRARWADYMAAYADALERCNTDAAPWYVIPAGRKWYRNWAVAALLNEQLGAMGLTWPNADFDVEAEKQRLDAL
jgi:PPK2 family polyphosphate:nucleotide phosphotransferase